ncbi:conserved protein of unknown function [Tenacibaculum sp. 190524A02b]|uniref:hypothetical protein n=1 Tax=Tenacibaculum vairaonense TaxID=3137860 RepID=UPI0032B2C5C6
MAESARTIYNLFLQDLAQFTAFNTRFTSEYATNFLNQIDTADTIVTDVSTLAKQGVETQKVLNSMQIARILYNRIKNHAQWAFPENSAIIKEFTSGYKKIHRSQPKMLVFLDTLEKVVAKYLEVLTDVTKGGMPANIVEELATVKEQLKTANVQQEIYKKERLVLTEERVSTLNDCYTTMIQINNTAQLIFANQPAKRAQYSYRPISSSATVTEFVGIVAPDETVVITNMSFETGKYISFENRGAATLQFDLSTDTTTLEGNMVELESGAMMSQPMDWLLSDVNNGTSINILAYNTSETEQGSYWVNINVD